MVTTPRRESPRGQEQGSESGRTPGGVDPDGEGRGSTGVHGVHAQVKGGEWGSTPGSTGVHTSDENRKTVEGGGPGCGPGGGPL